MPNWFHKHEERRAMATPRFALSLATVVVAASLLVGAVAAVTPPLAVAAAGTGTSGLTSFAVAGLLTGVAGTSADNAWAVGSTSTGKSLIAHWNGKAWKQVPSPSPGTHTYLASVAATSAGNAWAVGCTTQVVELQDCTGSLILHWNGTEWKRVPAPDSPGSSLTSVAATSATNAWAVGGSLILHWNGTVWKQVPSPPDTRVTSVAATSAGDAWAVGDSGTAGNSETLILHWNGKAWRQVSSPNPEPGGPGEPFDHSLLGVAVTSANNAWAVGQMTDCGCGPGVGLILHWNGSTWKQGPNSGTGLVAVAASAGEAWVVGGSGEGTSPLTTIALHWNGKVWKRVASPSPGTKTMGGGSGLVSVAITRGGSAWAVGSYATGKFPNIQVWTLILRWNGRAWI
jgi:hypothetical protein